MNMLIEKQGVKDRKYRRQGPDKTCICCGHPSAVLHHVGHDKMRDDHGIWLCGQCHAGFPESLHSANSEAVWLAARLPDLVLSGVKLWTEREYQQWLRR